MSGKFENINGKVQDSHNKKLCRLERQARRPLIQNRRYYFYQLRDSVTQFRYHDERENRKHIVALWQSHEKEIRRTYLALLTDDKRVGPPWTRATCLDGYLSIISAANSTPLMPPPMIKTFFASNNRSGPSPTFLIVSAEYTSGPNSLRWACKSQRKLMEYRRPSVRASSWGNQVIIRQRLVPHMYGMTVNSLDYIGHNWRRRWQVLRMRSQDLNIISSDHVPQKARSVFE